MDSKISLQEQRAATLRSLSHNASQASNWQAQLLGLVAELNNDNLKLRKGFAMVMRELEQLKKESVVVR